MSEYQSFPLAWPIAWPRTKSPKRSQFGVHTIGKCISEVHAQLCLIPHLHFFDRSGIVVSSNFLLRQDGLPRSGQPQPNDKGVAVYFKILRKAGKADERVLACDKWDRVEDNMWAIAKHIDALRGQQRWGVGTVEQAFAGYVELPSGEKKWWEVLEVDPLATAEQVKAAYRLKVKSTHPDVGGTREDFDRILRAYGESGYNV